MDCGQIATLHMNTTVTNRLVGGYANISISQNKKPTSNEDLRTHFKCKSWIPHIRRVEQPRALLTQLL